MAQTFTFAADLFTHSDLLCPFDPVALLQAMAADDPDDLDDDEEDEDDDDDDDEDEDEDDEDEDEDQEEEGGDDEDDADDDEDEEDEDLDDEDEGDQARSARGPLRRQNGHAVPVVRPLGPRMSRRRRR
jgi:hypothetical protein